MQVSVIDRLIKNNLYTIILCLSFAILVFPFYIFGPIGFYNDDFHFLETISQEGALSGIKHWLREYGVFYRPVAIVLLYLLYFLLGSSPIAIYSFSYLLFSLLGYLTYRVVSKATSSQAVGLVSFLFVIFFIFSSTAFLQNSSSCMNWGTVLSLLLFSHIYFKESYYKHSHLAKYSLLWLILCFNYEQVLGISCAFIITLSIKHFSKEPATWIKTVIKPTIYFGVTSSVFLLTYLTAQTNPKMTSLKKFNTDKVSIEKKKVSNKSLTEIEIKKTLHKKGRIAGLRIKLLNVSRFLKLNYFYSIQEIKKEGVQGFIYFFLVIILALLCLLLRPHIPTLKVSMALFITGSSWTFFTVAPFLLYRNFSMPPYTLTVPSIGVAIVLASLPGLLLQITNKKIAVWSLKIIAIFISLTFPISQIGYYFGLKYELTYWDSVAKELSLKFPSAVTQNIEVVNLPDKTNKHIFWMRKTIGTRYIDHILTHPFKKFKLESPSIDRLNITNEEYDSAKSIIINAATQLVPKN